MREIKLRYFLLDSIVRIGIFSIFIFCFVYFIVKLTFENAYEVSLQISLIFVAFTYLISFLGLMFLFGMEKRLEFLKSQIIKVFHLDFKINKMPSAIFDDLLKKNHFFKVIEISDENRTFYFLIRSISMKSFGEVVVCCFDQSKDINCFLYSESLVTTTFFDFGANQRNLKKIRSLIVETCS